MAKRAGRHAYILRVLRNRILRGFYHGKLPGGRALADEFDIDPKTVYIALAQLEALGLVHRTEREGTVATEHPRDAAVMYARLVLLVPFTKGKANFWTSVMVYGFQESARERNLSVAPFYSDSADTQLEGALSASKEFGCVGTCFLAVPMETRHVLHLAGASGPVVVADWHIEEPLIPSVEFDDLDGGRLAAEHLVKLGHRAIAFIEPEPSSPNAESRRKGADAYLTGVGLKPAERMSLGDDMFACLDRLLARPDRPKAVITTFAFPAEILVGLAAHRGVRVPQDMSVITFGDSKMEYRTPLTLVATDHEALGRRALDALLDEDLWANPRRVLLPVKLADFGSTAPPHD